jgi:hypothetical protein
MSVCFPCTSRHDIAMYESTDHVTLNFNNNMSTAAVNLDIEKPLILHGLLYKLSKLKFPTSLIKLNSSFLSQRTFRVSVEGEISTPREIQVWTPQGSFPCPTLYIIYINGVPQTPGAYLAFFTDTCPCATERKEGYVLRKLQRGLSSIETWCERWNIKASKEKTQAIYFTHRLRPPKPRLLLNRPNIPFLNSVKRLGVIFDKRITC